MRAALALALLVGAPAGAQEDADWRRVATAADRARLRDWRAAWLEGLAQARGDGNATAVAAAGELLDPDRALARPMPPVGDYRCRLVRLGSKRAGQEAFVDHRPVRCRLSGNGLRFEILEGTQRPIGRLYANDGARAIFLGSLRIGDDMRGLPYGRDSGRDVAGYVERIGERRWRLALPRPRFDAIVDVIEITPAQASGGSEAR